MPTGTGKGDGDPGSHSNHFGYLESKNIPGHHDEPLYKAYRRTGPKGRSLPKGKSSEFKLARYYCIEMPDHVNPGNGMNQPPWIHIALLYGEESTKNQTDADLGIEKNDPIEDPDAEPPTKEDVINQLQELIKIIGNSSRP